MRQICNFLKNFFFIIWRLIFIWYLKQSKIVKTKTTTLKSSNKYNFIFFKYAYDLIFKKNFNSVCIVDVILIDLFIFFSFDEIWISNVFKFVWIFSIIRWLTFFMIAIIDKFMSSWKKYTILFLWISVRGKDITDKKKIR